MGKCGRPSKLSNRVIKQAETLAGFGLTEEQISQVIGVTALTIRRWKANKEYCSALKRGKVQADQRVIESLYKRAIGYGYKEITREQTLVKIDTNGKHLYKVLPTKIIDKQYAPDVTACIFWLKNRIKEDWRDVKNVEGKVVVEHKEFFNGLLSKSQSFNRCLTN